MKALVISPRKTAKLVDLKDVLETYQEIVGGYIEVVYPFNDDVCLICNEEGLLIGLDPNRFVNGQLIVGSFIIIGVHGAEFKDLTDEQISKYKKLFGLKSFI